MLMATVMEWRIFHLGQVGFVRLLLSYARFGGRFDRPVIQICQFLL
jgi:hypothetical protein